MRDTELKFPSDRPQAEWSESWGASIVLLIAAFLAFFYNVPLSLFGVTEGLYASVTETMVRTGEYVHLTLYDQPYRNKPPLFFWLQAGSTKLLGWNEMALRLPSALCSVGTVGVTYMLGKTLWSRTAGFWAALVVMTSYASVWFGQMAIIDPILTFFMTLGIYGFTRAYFLKGSEWWYVLGFVALAFGAMVKNLHALVMPVFLFVIFWWILRDRKALKSSHFWLGVIGCGVILGSYFMFLGQEFWQHFFLKENVQRMTKLAGDTQGSALEAYFGKRPIHWYLYVIWFDFFPWSLLIPTSLLILWRQRPLRAHPKETFLLVWVLGYLLAFSLLPEKHERYLMPMVPGVAMMIGYFYHQVLVSHDLKDWNTSLLRVMLGLLSTIFLVLIFLAPYLLSKKWNVPTGLFPISYQVLMVGGISGLIYATYRSYGQLALKMIGVLAVGLMMGMVMFVIPGIDAVASSKLVFTETQSALRNPTDPIRTYQHWHWRNDEDQYYWQHVHKSTQIVGNDLSDSEALEALKGEIRREGPIVILMTKQQYEQLVEIDRELEIKVVREFLRPKKTIVLLSIKFKA